MSLSVSSTSAVSPTGATDPAAKASAIAQRMMKDLDGDSDGKISKDEFVSGLQAKGVAAEDAGTMFDAIDKQKTGSIGKSDIEAAAKDGTLKPPSRGGKAGGAEGGKGAGGAAAAGSSSSKSYEKADLNEDGTVSEAERMIYEMRQASKATQATEASKGTLVDKLA